VTESQLVHDILEAWGAHPRVRLARINTGKGYPPGSDRLVTFGVPGTPDICGVLAPQGRWLGIEVKSAEGRQRRDQQRFQRVITRFGGVYILARSVEDVDRALAGLWVTR
jgi:hypothetical protein